MKNIKSQFDNLKGSFCAAPAPFLWNSLFLIIPLLTLFLVGLSFSLLLDVYKNKKKGVSILDKKVKNKFIFLFVVAFSLLTYGLVGLSFNYYLLVYFFICIWILLGFFVGEHLKIFKIKREFWIGMTLVATIFAIAFGVCYMQGVREKIAQTNGVQLNCFNRSLF